MTFRAPEMLWLLALVPFALVLFVARERRRARLARRFVAERLRGVANAIRPARPWLAAIALAASLFALAGPRAGFTTVPLTQRESNRVVVLDVSNSMAAEDVGTSRMAAAKALAKRILDAHPGRVGLIIFEARAEIIAPLTSDSDAVIALLDSVQAGEIGEAGSDIGTAVINAAGLIEADPRTKADIVVISDGEEQGRRLANAIQRARDRAINVSAVMLGSAEGSTIPLPGGAGVLRDDNGRIVTTYARADALTTLARSTGGLFLENPFAEDALDPLLARRVGGRERERDVKVPVDRYQWPLAVAFAMFLCASVANRGAE